jgi:5-methylcytosine-specific restriction endonuclease McrA
MREFLHILPLIALVIFVIGMVYILVPRRKHSKFYRDYIKSTEWNVVRKRALARANYACESCGNTGVTLQVHHLTYTRLSHELDSDLKVLCVKCHKAIHKTPKRKLAWA